MALRQAPRQQDPEQRRHQETREHEEGPVEQRAPLGLLLAADRGALGVEVHLAQSDPTARVGQDEAQIRLARLVLVDRRVVGAPELEPDAADAGPRLDVGREVAARGEALVEGEERDRDVALDGARGAQDAVRRAVQDADVAVVPAAHELEVLARGDVEGPARPQDRAILGVEDQDAVDLRLLDERGGAPEKRALRCARVRPQLDQRSGSAVDPGAPLVEPLLDQPPRVLEPGTGIRHVGQGDAQGRHPREQGSPEHRQENVSRAHQQAIIPASSIRTSRSSCRGSSAAFRATQPSV